jgi:hypothetical protein
MDKKPTQALPKGRDVDYLKSNVGAALVAVLRSKNN